jgi:RNase P subunit RPR2
LLKRDIPNAIISDSNSAIDITNNPTVNDRTKHIDIAYHFTREQVEAGNITVLYVPSAENLADICSKGLSQEILQPLCKKCFCTK